MKRFLAITLGIITSIGGFFDMGEIVMTGETGARFGYALIWVVVVGTIGIVVYAEMAGRVATLSKRPVFDVVRERLGARFGFLNLSASVLINLITLVAEIAGLAIAFQLVTTVNYYLWIPLAVALVMIVIWKVSFEHMERGIGLLGMAMLVFAFAFARLGPDLGTVVGKIVEPDIPKSETIASYWYFAIALFGAAMTPYEVFFYSSGAVEEKWERRDLIVNRVTSYVGFFFGAFLAMSAIGLAAVVFKPQGITIDTLSQVSLGPAAALGSIGLALFIVGLFAATFGAALEVALSTGYCLAQYFGWTWGKFEKPKEAARFHLSIIVCVVLAAAVVLTSVDPVKVTELAVVFSAIGLPLTYFPVLLVANDAEYMGDQANGRLLNVVASFFLLVVVAASVAAIPLMIWTRMGS